MKIQKLLMAFSFILVVSSSISMAQVTIGSGESPANGALLQLKNISGISSDAPNATKGLGLPRVALTNKTNLFPMFSLDNDYVNNVGGKKDDEDQKHIGLVVYNTASGLCNPLSIGVNVWTGTNWVLLSKGVKKDALYAPNSYMIETDGTAGGATSITIPVEKAYAIWEYYGSPEVGRLPENVDLTGVLTANIYWQESTAPIGTPTVTGTDRTASITVPVNGVYGNAVVSLSIGGVVRWSWHIWVTPPMTTNTFNGNVWMDRNLGATSTAIEDINRYGLYYQQGRKDPFPRAVGRDNDTEPTLFPGGVATQKTETQVSSDPLVNLSVAINAPLTFIWSGDSYLDWYSTGSSDPKLQWNNRWTTDECNIPVKTSFDPCPEGWHVPAFVNDVSIWQGLTTANWEEAEDGWGVIWTNPDAGAYPGQGIRGGTPTNQGRMEYNRTHVYVWATSNHGEQSDLLGANYPGGFLDVNSWAGRVDAAPVRCVKFN
ncbi:MAG: hypothetical protein ACK5M3_14840 [Dysgonomonas sp.]